MNKKIDLETSPIGSLLLKFAIPSIIALIVNSLYNIVDQIFIGNYVGYLGNTATTIAFPLITIAMSFALAIGNGAGAYFSLKLGEKKYKEATRTVYYTLILLAIVSIIYYIIISIFLNHLLYIFGATNESIKITLEYTKIIIIGLPFSLFTTGFMFLIRADTAHKFVMFTMILGASLNVLLDKILIVNYNLGIKGAAIATVISQITVFIIMISYINRFKMVKINILLIGEYFLKFNFYRAFTIIFLGASSFVTQIGFTLVQIVMNNVIKIYGQNSIYGTEIPIAAFGISGKVIGILVSLIIGIGIGAGPILGYNFGAKNYERVINTYKYEIKFSSIIALLGSLIFILFPEYIVNIFGKEKTELYTKFAINCFRIYLSCVFVIGFQINSAMFFQAIGKPLKSMLLNMSRQILLLIPLLIILPIKFGLEGIFLAAPISDILSTILTFYFIKLEIKNIKKERKKYEINNSQKL